ncbi:DUF5683 domain-containing protein [Flavobacterium sp.]|uniref:DUF5683 domain-containing protein n=1 Tax=Flavobacterium sp. TaxID=239 RepID=UPI0038FCEFB7
MKNWFYIVFFVTVFGNFSGFSQDDLKLIALDTTTTKINPLAPAKAAFYSALLPGLGQAYNKKYWKVPIVFAAIGTGIYAYSWNKKKYTEYRDAYKERLLLGTQSTDAFNNQNNGGVYLSEAKLIDAQKQFQRQKDLSLLVTVALYILNIVDANVDGHLRQFNVNGKLTVRPDIYKSDTDYTQNLGVTINYNF